MNDDAIWRKALGDIPPGETADFDLPVRLVGTKVTIFGGSRDGEVLPPGSYQLHLQLWASNMEPVTKMVQVHVFDHEPWWALEVREVGG